MVLCTSRAESQKDVIQLCSSSQQSAYKKEIGMRFNVNVSKH